MAGWSAFTTKGCEFAKVPGGHFSPAERPQGRFLRSLIRDWGCLACSEKPPAAAAWMSIARSTSTTRPYPEQSTVKDLFERCATEFPGRIAIVCGGESITYRELNRLANGLAARLCGSWA